MDRDSAQAGFTAEIPLPNQGFSARFLGNDFTVLIGGNASVNHENFELAERDLANGERFGVPVALIVLLILFGAVVATLLPLGLSIVSIIIALAAVAEAALAHAVGNSVEQAYHRTDLLEKRRELMQAWADFLTSESVQC